MRQCVLCREPASVHCESDRADLCWDCDAKVHGANFLVARHSRCLLCRSCTVLTPWKASGPRLYPTVSVCDRCSGLCDLRVGKMDFHGGDVDDLSDSDADVDFDEDEDDLGVSADELQDDDVDNQVVPWGTEPPARTPPPPASPPSSNDQSSPGSFTTIAVRDPVPVVRRTADNVDLTSSQSDRPRSTPIYSHHPSPAPPPYGSPSGDEATSSSGPSAPDRIQKMVAPPLRTLTQLNCRTSSSPFRF